MRKFKVPVLTGGAPLHGDRLEDELNREIWDPIQAILSRFDADTEGVIVKGCVLSNNGGNFDMTAGIVYLNGEFMRIAAQTNQAFTKYIAPASVNTIQKTFNDGITKDLIEEKTATLVGSIPGAGQYITIGSLASRRRFDEWGKYETLSFMIDGGGAVIQTGSKGARPIPFDFEITSVELWADVSGSIVVDLWVDTYANWPPTVADKITASAPPTITTATKSQDATLTGWTKQLPRGRQLLYNVNSVTSITNCTVVLYGKRILL